MWFNTDIREEGKKREQRNGKYSDKFKEETDDVSSSLDLSSAFNYLRLALLRYRLKNYIGGSKIAP